MDIIWSNFLIRISLQRICSLFCVVWKYSTVQAERSLLLRHAARQFWKHVWIIGAKHTLGLRVNNFDYIQLGISISKLARCNRTRYNARSIIRCGENATKCSTWGEPFRIAWRRRWISWWSFTLSATFHFPLLESTVYHGPRRWTICNFKQNLLESFYCKFSRPLFTATLFLFLFLRFT